MSKASKVQRVTAPAWGPNYPFQVHYKPRGARDWIFDTAFSAEEMAVKHADRVRISEGFRTMILEIKQEKKSA